MIRIHSLHSSNEREVKKNAFISSWLGATLLGKSGNSFRSSCLENPERNSEGCLFSLCYCFHGNCVFAQSNKRKVKGEKNVVC